MGTSGAVGCCFFSSRCFGAVGCLLFRVVVFPFRYLFFFVFGLISSRCFDLVSSLCLLLRRTVAQWEYPADMTFLTWRFVDEWVSSCLLLVFSASRDFCPSWVVCTHFQGARWLLGGVWAGILRLTAFLCNSRKTLPFFRICFFVFGFEGLDILGRKKNEQWQVALLKFHSQNRGQVS